MFACLESLILSFRCNFFAYIKFHLAIASEQLAKLNKVN